MKFKTKLEFLDFLNNMLEYEYFKKIGIGSQGICYLDVKSNKVYKIFHQFDDEFTKECEDFCVNYTKEEILRFSHIQNDTFVWASNVIIVGEEIIGYISEFIEGKTLYTTNPLLINLDEFAKGVKKVDNDIKIISNNNVKTYDVMYNTIYGKDGIFIKDYDEYCYSDMDSNKLYEINTDNFNLEIMYFLIDNYFDEFISKNKTLKEMYKSKGININEFICLFKTHLSETLDKEIIYLKDAKKCLNKKRNKCNYQRILY